MSEYEPCGAEDRSAQATEVIREKLKAAGFEPSLIAESGNGPAMFTFNVAIDDFDYQVEVAAAVIE